MCQTVHFIIIEPAHEKHYNKTYVTNKDSDQPVCKGSCYLSLDSTEAVEDTSHLAFFINL